MALNLDRKKQTILWISILFIVLAVVMIIIKVKDSSQGSAHPAAKQGELKKMMGIKGVSPEKLKSYQSVNGVVDIQHWVTKHGVRVYFVHIPTLPMVDIQVVFDAGAARNGDKGGLAYLTNALLNDGTDKLDADQVAQNFDNVGAQLRLESQRDMALVHLRTLSDQKQLIPAVQTLVEILNRPSFPETGFKREQLNALSALKQQAQKPQHVASRAFYTSLYGNHPYANWVLGDESSIKALTLEDVKAFYKKYYVSQNAVVTIVGDISIQDADAVAQALTNNLPEGSKPAIVPPVVDIGKKVVQKIDFPSEQTMIVMGMPGVTRNDPDYYTLHVGNHILGGNGSVTRLFDVIRNQHGLAYSVYSYFMPMRERGPFILSSQTRNNQAAKSEALMENLLREFVEKGPTDKELEQAKKNLLGGYSLQFDSNSAITNQVAQLGFYGLPLDYFDRFKKEVEKITVNDIKRAFSNRIHPDNIIVVTVGGKSGDQAVAPLGPMPSSHHGGESLPGSPQG